jgi:thiol-disulfide isomerase/thioredoxin
MLKIARNLAPVVFISLVAACASSSSKSGGGGGGGDPDQGVAGDGTSSAASAPDKNPDGVPYPTTNLGTTARKGKTPGNTMYNYKFLGYPDGDTSKGLQPLSLANFFDPEGKRYKLIHIQASGSWCVHCQKETETVTPLKAKLEAKKVVWLISLAEGIAVGTPATKGDLDKWMTNFKAPYTHLWDPGNKNFGPFYDAAALPWNANVYAKTMEILSSGVGAAESEAAIMADIDPWLQDIDSGAIK